MEDIKAYLLSIFATALLITVVDILAPANAGGVSKHLKLVLSLVFVCVLISPTVTLAERLLAFSNGDWELEIEGDLKNHYSKELQNALDDASKDYFEDMLTLTISQEFDILEDNLRLHVEWDGEGESLRPYKVTLILSGSAIWKNPAKMEEYVSSLLGCDCVSAIE